MIKINLLETAKGKSKRGGGGGASMPSMEMGDMGSPKLKVLVVVVIAGLFNLGYWYRLDHQSKEIAAHMKVAELKNRELADVKARFLERQTQANNYKRRVDVIDGEGTALSTDAVANLIANLQKTGFFKNVEIKETFQDEQIKDMQAFQFTLTCEKGKS